MEGSFSELARKVRRSFSSIAVGIYTTPTFVTALQTALNSQGSGQTFTTTYNELTQTFLRVQPFNLFGLQVLVISRQALLLAQHQVPPH